MEQRLILSLAGISKAFGSTQALRQLHLDIRPGEVVTLMGANGSGKSTLVRIISGVFAPDGGTMTLEGLPFRPQSPRQARSQGVVAVHQIIADVGVPTLSVAENLCLDRLCDGRQPFFVGKRSLKKQARQIAEAIGLVIDLDAPFDSLTIAEQQLVALARGVSAKPRLIIFDEPTASLSPAEAERLFQVIDHLRGQGAAILYISHRIDDLRRLADRVVVLRDGRVVAQQSAPLDFKAAITAMIGRDLSIAPQTAPRTVGEVVLDARDLQLKPHSAPFDLTLRKGEIVAITGAVGSGKAHLAEILAGIKRPFSGAITLENAPWKPRNQAEAIDQGVFYAGEDRWRSSLFPDATPFSNIAGTLSFPFLSQWFAWGWLNRRREDDAAHRAIVDFGIKCSGPQARLTSLSGGNQQKVVLARWHLEPAKLLILVEPFQAIDIGARDDLIRVLKSHAQDRATLVFVSDHEEAIEIADRILFMNHHSLTATSQDQDVLELSRLSVASA